MDSLLICIMHEHSRKWNFDRVTNWKHLGMKFLTSDIDGFFNILNPAGYHYVSDLHSIWHDLKIWYKP